MIQSDQPLPVTRRCELLKVARSTAYCRPGPVSHEDVVLMRLIDEIHLELPFYGSRRIRDELETRGHPDQSQARPASDAPHGCGGAVPETSHQRAGSRP